MKGNKEGNTPNGKPYVRNPRLWFDGKKIASATTLRRVPRLSQKLLFGLVLAMLTTIPSSVFGDVAKGVFAAGSGKETVAVRKVTAASTGTLQSDTDTLVFKYTFPAPTFEEQDDGTATVRMNGVENLGDVGDPSLPTLAVRLAVPKGRELLTAECDGDLVQVASGVVLRHVYRPIPTSATITEETPRNEAVYSSDDPFPKRCFSEQSIASKRGVKFVDFSLTPVMYKGQTGEVWYYPEITVVLFLKPQGAGTPRLMSTSAVDANGVRSKDDTDAVVPLLDNPEEVESYVPSKSSGGAMLMGTSAPISSANYSSIPYVHPTLPCQTDGDFPAGYRHVIITSQALLSAFEQLVMYRRGQGVSSTAVTVEEIKNNYSGIDTQDQIRNFIKDAYQTWKTEFIVLGGDTGHVPARYLYCCIQKGTDTEESIPSDLYYQCLDGDFNADEDSVWGETNDGVDWYAEVAIGRVPAENTSEVNNWYSKLVQYNNDVANDAAYTHRMLSVGEDMNSNGSNWGSSRWASVFMEQTRVGGRYDGYSTKGFDDSASYTTRDTLYDSASYTWQANDLISKINANKYAVLNHLGHGNYNCNMKLASWDVDSKIKNTSPIFVYSWACISGSFDRDCIAEHFMTSSQYGCFGGVWNARYGWGSINSTDSNSQRLARHFWNAAFTATDTKNGTTGLANQLSHERNASYVNDPYYRWVIYETNLFGDPIQQIDGVTLSGGGSQLGISKPSVTFSAAGGVGSADVTASSSWTATPSDPWITLNTTSGNGNGTISYSVSANTGTSERTGAITVRSGNETATQRITQSAEAASLRVSPTVKDFGCGADSGSFDVQANYSWTVEKSVPWITLGTTGGIGNGRVLYSVTENTGARREGTITVRIGSMMATHNVTQAAQPQLNISPTSKTLPAASGNCSITVTSDSMWTVSKSATWISLDKTSGTGNGTITYTVSENTGSKREGWIYVTCGSVQRTHFVTQNRADSVTFSEQSATISSDGGTGSFTVTILGNNRVVTATASTVPWASWTWATENLSEGIRYTFTYTVEANPTIQKRETAIPIGFNGTVYNFTITQMPYVNNFLVTYRPGTNGTGSEAYDVKQKNVPLTLRGAIFTRTGYTQTGWATTDGGGKVYDLGVSYTDNAALTLYPYWEPGSFGNTTYTLRFNPGPYGSGNEQTAVKYEGVAFTLPGALYTREGYEQTGWSVFRSGTSKTYELGGTYGNDIASTFYPYWSEKPNASYDIGFYSPSTYKQPICLSTTNLAYWSYAPQYVFRQGDGLVLNYCVRNKSGADATLVDRLMSLWDANLNMLKGEMESHADTIPTGSGMLFPNRNLNSWMTSISPGNYALKVSLDPNGQMNDSDVSDNIWTTWFAVKAEGITLNEALDCSSLYFTDNGTTAFPQTSESVVGGSCVQLGPQPTNSFDSSVLWVYVTEPGTLTFKWKVTSQDGYNAFLGCYVNGNLATYKWATEQTEWEEASVTVDSAQQWICWRLGSNEPDANYLTAGWVDCVTWSGDDKKPTFTVDANGTVTAVELNGAVDIVIPSMVNGIAVRAIGSRVFEKTAITSVSIHDAITNIANHAFLDCASLAGISIPGSVKSIGDTAFCRCHKLRSVVLEEGLEKIGNTAFYNCLGLTYVKLPSTVLDIGYAPFGHNPSLKTIDVAQGNTKFCTMDYALVDKSVMGLIQYPMGRNQSSYEVPEGIVAIAYCAFDWATNLTSVTLPTSLIGMGNIAFGYCSSLETVSFKGNAPNIGGAQVFLDVPSSCKALVSPQSTGWGVAIPGTWQGIGIEYSAALQTYSVSYKPGACGTGSQQSETKQYGIALPLKGAIFTRTGYAQTGWATSDGGAKVYELGASYTANVAVTLYPHWTANTYVVSYGLDGGTAGAAHPVSATYGTPFRVSAPTRNGYVFAGWMATSGLDITTARYGGSSTVQSTDIDNASMQCSNGSDVDVWFINLTPQPDGEVVLTATWEPVVDDSRDIGFYAPANQGWSFPVCLSSTNIEYLAYAPETQFVQGMGVYLSFCAVNWSRTGSAMLQSTLLTITDESGAIFDQGEPIQLATIGAFGYREIRNMSMRRYLSGITPGRYKLTLELDPNRLLNDPDRSNNTTSIWFTVTAPADPIPELPFDATAADVRVALAGSADERLAENITDVSTYSAYRNWAQTVKGLNGTTVAGKQAVKNSDKAWFSFAIDSAKLVVTDVATDDVKIEGFDMSPNGGQFDFTVGITGIEVGDAAISERLKTVFGIEGASQLNGAEFSPDSLTLEAARPEGGKVKLTVKPTAPRTDDGPAASAFFMRAKVQVN